MSNQTELRHFRYFLSVAEELHFKKAAEKLFISQPGLSRQIQQMERYMGVQLFERNNKKVELTPAGHYLKKELHLVMRNIENISSHAQLLSKGIVGSIKMAYVGSAMQNVVPELLLQIDKHNKNIHFSLEELNNNKQIEALLSHQIDIGFVRLNQVPEELNIQPIWRETFSVVLPSQHQINAKNFKGIEQLSEEHFIFFEKSYSPVYHARMMSIFEDAGFSPKVSHNTVHANTIFRLVENNFGVSVVPTSLQLGYQMDIQFIELKDIPQRATLFVVWSKKNRNPALEQILKIIKKMDLKL